MARPKPARHNDGLERLERKLAVYANGYPPSSRSAALAILTGTGPAVAATQHATLRLVSSQVEEHRPRFHIERTRPPRRFQHRWRTAVAVVAILAAAGLAVMRLTTVNENAQQEPAPVDATVVPIEVALEPTLVVAEPTPLPQPAESNPSVPVPATQMGVLLDEHFASNANAWPDDPNSTAWLAHGTYWLAPRQQAHFVAIGIPGARDLGDTVVSAWFHKVGGPQGGGYGLILRDQESEALDGQNQAGHYYVFEAGDRGQFGVWLRDGDHWVDLLTWTSSDSVNGGTAANELTVTAMGDQLSFLVNGTPVATQTDTLLHKGAAGVFVGGDGNQVALDRLTVRIPR